MSSPNERSSALNDKLRERVLKRLGFASPPAVSLDGLRAVYRAWCASVPFDNVRKMIALRNAAKGPLPGGNALDFCQSWLEHGAGGTCWPTSNALCEMLCSLGFEAQRLAGSMCDVGVLNHASGKVVLDECAWLVDSSLLHNVPLPLKQEVVVHEDAVFRTELEAEKGSHVVWMHLPPHSSYLPCRLFPDGVSHAFYLAQYEESRAQSVFNQSLYARRNLPGEMLVLLGNTRFSKTAQGVEGRVLSPDELCEALRRDIGLSTNLIDEWARSGSLAASFEPPSGTKPPPITRFPPSLR